MSCLQAIPGYQFSKPQVEEFILLLATMGVDTSQFIKLLGQ
jgi:hypothetical protein